MDKPLCDGTVVWTGDNPGIYLREAADKPFLSLALHFRVVTSPRGRGRAALVIGEPDAAAPSGVNVCVTDNEPMMRWMVEEFVHSFGAFKGLPGMRSLRYEPLVRAATDGDGIAFHQETLAGPQTELVLRWETLSAPFAADVPPNLSATGRHRMLSVFQEASYGTIGVNGRLLPGRPMSRDFLGTRLNTAFLAFSETWIAP